MPMLKQNHLRHTSLWIVGAFLLSSCGAPLGLIPGGKLEGELSPWPANWDHAEDCENVLLETDPADPYSVTIWGVGVKDEFSSAHQPAQISGPEKSKATPEWS